VVTHEPLSNGDGLNVLVKREVVGFRANIAEPKGEFEEDGQKRYRYRVEPNEMPEGLYKLRPNHRCRATSTTTGSRPCRRPPPNAGRPGVARAASSAC
jgi:hypothetical protein